jgi:uncharacterized membrane protein
MYNSMMNDGWMGGMNGGMWVWPVLATLVAVLIIVVIVKLLKNNGLITQTKATFRLSNSLTQRRGDAENNGHN